RGFPACPRSRPSWRRYSTWSRLFLRRLWLWSAIALVTGQMAADDHPLDLVRPLEDLHDLHLAHVALERELARVAIAAEHLDRVGRDPHRVVGREELGHRRLRTVGLAGIASAGGGQVESTGGFDARRHVGEQERHALEVDDPLAELLAFPGVRRRSIERGLGNA